MNRTKRRHGSGSPLFLAALVALVALVPLPAAGESLQPNDPVIAGNGRFGFDLLERLIEDEPSENVFISPASISLALTMTLNGAEGETFDQMANVLGLTGLEIEDINSVNADLLEIDWARYGIEDLSIVNSLWADRGFSFEPGFMKVNRDVYGARITTLDLQDPETPERINAWVRDATRERIDRIVGVIPDFAVLYLINAVYFKGAWKEPFEEKNTEEEDFFLLDGTPTRVPMMFNSGSYRYLDGEGFQAIALPYGVGRICMYVLLPDRDVGLAGFLAGLDGGTWGEWIGELRSRGPRDGSLKMPRFELEYGVSLGDFLQPMGMAVAFDPARADFSRMIPEQVWIDEVKHKTYLKVNEEGTEAAAGTSVGIALSIMPERREPFRMVVNRPFFVAVRDNATGWILFMGVVADPRP